MKRSTLLQSCATVALLALALPTGAQLRLPQVPQVPLPNLPAVRDLNESAQQRVRESLAPRDLAGRRAQTIRELLQRHGDALEADPGGAPAVRGEVVALSPSAAALEAARAQGFTVAREEALEGLDERAVMLRAPAGMTAAQALQRLRAIDPHGTYDFNHLYLGGGAPPGAAAAAPPDAPAQAQGPKLGLIDGGVDVRHPALRHAEVRSFGCGGQRVPSTHGTAVASLLVGRARGFAGAAPGAALYAADVYCGEPTGGAAAQLLAAFAWLARERVPVINVSLVGPPNAALERVIKSLAARGHLIVAAVGNDGPAAPPLYPAAYPEVIAVTGVDAHDRALPEAGRGPHVAFAAPGADMLVAVSGSDDLAPARGTSYAAPLVAGLLAITASDGSDPVDALKREAIDLGPPGRDPIYGYGLVGRALRVDPIALRNSRAR
ncbi:MAG: S8 family serine peptidase [Burkholderiaceae bacterium]